jgi:hypothetical protein
MKKFIHIDCGAPKPHGLDQSLIRFRLKECRSKQIPAAHRPRGF